MSSEEHADLPEELQDELPPPQRASGDSPGLRQCMSCAESFLSEGWHNRLCPKCRRRSVAEG